MRSIRCLLALPALLLAAVPGIAGGPNYRVSPYGFGLGFYPPSYYGYNLWETNPGYYGGANYREYYSYGRGYGLANYPGPVPGPMYRSEPSSIEPPKRLRPIAAPPVVPEHPLPLSPPPSNTVAHLIVQVPTEAEVWLEGVKTKQSGATRHFLSPPLNPDARYAYEIKARWLQDGHEVEQSQEVPVRAGEQVNVRFPTTGPDLEVPPPPKPLPPELGR